MTHWIVLAATAAALIGRWQGAISVMGTDLGIQVEFTRSADSLAATIDIPAQAVSGFRMRDVRLRGDSLSFVLPAPGATALFDGVVRGDSIAGAFRQAGITASFHLARSAERLVAADSTLPYDAEEVRIESADAMFAGTLTRPRGSGRYPALVLVSGSGAEDRDETLFGFKPFAILADHLTRNGFAVLRCDDRGAGSTVGKVAGTTSHDYAGDLRAQIRFLAARKEIDPRRIGMLGHSEGGIIGPLAAVGNDSIAFLVLLAPPGIRGDSVLFDQGERITRMSTTNDTVLALNREAVKRLAHASVTNQGWDSARVGVENMLRYTLGSAVADSVITGAANVQVKMFKSAWMRSFLILDPAPILAQVRCPVLALFGANDLQVAPEVNAPPLERALRRGGNRDVTVRVLPRANHLFQETDSGSPMLYGTLKKEFVPGLLDTVTTWLVARTRPAAAKPPRAAKR